MKGRQMRRPFFFAHPGASRGSDKLPTDCSRPATSCYPSPTTNHQPPKLLPLNPPPTWYPSCKSAFLTLAAMRLAWISGLGYTANRFRRSKFSYCRVREASCGGLPSVQREVRFRCHECLHEGAGDRDWG